MIEAVILAGGLGTRLKPVVADRPKSMAEIGDKPFLWYLLRYLYREGVQKVILATEYKHEDIAAYFGEKFEDMDIEYSVEAQPLGTGGAIKKALERINADNALILNGDTFYPIKLGLFISRHLELASDITVALKPMVDFSRYGAVFVQQDRIVRFMEKKYHAAGLINGGIYLVKRAIFRSVDVPEKFSFETDFLEKYLDRFIINAYITDTYFIDIGVPEDYRRAQAELKAIITDY